MDINSLTKEQRLLMFMESVPKQFNSREYADQIISNGIAKNKNTLAAMLNNLNKKQLVRCDYCYGGNFKPGDWSLSEAGIKYADQIIDCWNNNRPVPTYNSNTSENSSSMKNLLATLAQQFKAIAANLKLLADVC